MSPVVFGRNSSSGVRWSAGITQNNGDSMVHFQDSPDRREEFQTALCGEPFWAEASLNNEMEDQIARIRTFPTLFDETRYLSLSATVHCSDADTRNKVFCDSIASSIADAIADLNPTFGRVEQEPSGYDQPNVDIGLRRRPSVSVPIAREILRGYAWLTVLPEDALIRLGGRASLEASGAFARIRVLRAGGALLQASPTIAEYADDAVMDRVFRALSPVLPSGIPSPYYVFPNARFTERDAREAESD